MLPLTAVRLVVTTSSKENAIENYNSYTLPNTPFYFKPIEILSSPEIFSKKQILWNFGDGTTYTGSSAEHFYKYPGVYDISATLYNKDGIPFLVNLNRNGSPIQLKALNAIPDLVVVKDLLPSDNLGVYRLPSGKRSDPLKIYRYNSWQNDSFLNSNNYSIMLYASGSKSNFMSVSSYYTDKWSHLKSYFGFIETYITPEGVVSARLVDSTRTTSTSVFAERLNDTNNLLFYNYPKENTSFAGTTGTSIDFNVSYVDQTPSSDDNSLVFIFSNFNTKGFLELDSTFNNKEVLSLNYPYGFINYPTKVTYLKSTFNPAVNLAITSNGISVEGYQQILGPLTGQFLRSFDIYPIKFTKTEIPFVVTFKDAENYTTKCYPPITGFRFDGNDPTEINTVSLGLYKLSEQDPTASYAGISSYRITEAIFKNNDKLPKFNNSGSYFGGLLYTNKETRTVAICASALVQDINIANVGLGYGFAAQPGFKNIKRFTKKSIYSNCGSENLEFSLDGNIETYFTSSTSSNIVSIAPLKTYNLGNIDRVWIADPDEDRVNVYNLSGEKLKGYSLSALPTFKDNLSVPNIDNYLGDLNSASPSNIAIDSRGNAWITLYDAISTIRINGSNEYVDRIVLPDLKNQVFTDYRLYLNSKAQLSGYVGENFILPTCVDTDINDNVWIGYSHPISSFLVHYTSDGNAVKTILLDPLHSVQEIISDKNNNLFAFAKNLNQNNPNAYNNLDKIYKWDANYNLVPGFPMEFNSIGNITIDLKQNLYVHHDFCKVTQITFNNLVNTFDIGNATYNSRYYQGIDGIGMDSDDYLWVLHNFDGKIYYYPVASLGTTSLSALYSTQLPDIQLSAFDGSQAFYRAYGDWTGIRWINKYSSLIQPQPRIIRGCSTLFDIIDNSPVINKINENFDSSSNYKSYILQESLFDRKELLDNFLGQIVGDINSDPEVLGKTVYEKIANFVSNISDPEVCNIDSLASLMKQYGLQDYNFAIGYPAGLKRAIDILSINQTKLFGSKNNYNKNFGLSASYYDLGKNLGEEISIETGKFNVGQPIVAFEKFSEKYKLINQTIVPETNGIVPRLGKPYPLSCVNYNWGWGLVTGNKSQSGLDIKPYYSFFNYKPTDLNQMVDGVIDFDNKLTSITPTLSSYQDWVKFGGIMDNILARSMYNGLDMFNNITGKNT